MESKVWIITKPSLGEYNPDCLRLETRHLPALKRGEVLLRTIYLSLDPTLRNWLKLEPGSSLVPLRVGDVMIGQTISVVEESSAEGFSRGDFVAGMTSWATYTIVEPAGLSKVKPGIPLEANMTIFNHIGFAAAAGMVGVADVKATDVVVVSAAAGATGSLAAQIAKGVGARVIGIAGGPEKCRYLTDDLGLDGAIDYKSEDVETCLAKLCPAGVTLFFDNVGGAILDAVLMNLALGARIVVCGQIAMYNSDDRKDGQGVRNLMQLVYRRARMEGFIAGEPKERMPEYEETLLRFYRDGKLNARSDIVKGFERAPESLKLLFSGENEGKLMVEFSAPTA